MRPKTIVYFEWIFFGTLLLGILHSYLDWDQITAQTPAFSASTTLIIEIFSSVFSATLALLVSRRRSKIAMWILIAQIVPGFPALFVQARTYGLGSVIIAMALQLIAYSVAFGLLFTPSARRWMNRKDEKLRDVFN